MSKLKKRIEKYAPLQNARRELTKAIGKCEMAELFYKNKSDDYTATRLILARTCVEHWKRRVAEEERYATQMETLY